MRHSDKSLIIFVVLMIFELSIYLIGFVEFDIYITMLISSAVAVIVLDRQFEDDY